MRITKNQLRKIIKDVLNESLANFAFGVKGTTATANWARKQGQRQRSAGAASSKEKTFASGADEYAAELSRDIDHTLHRITDEDIKDGFNQASEVIAYTEESGGDFSRAARKAQRRELIQLALLVVEMMVTSGGHRSPAGVKKNVAKYERDRSRLVELLPSLDDLLPIVVNDVGDLKAPGRFISKGNLEERKGFQTLRITKNQLRKIIKEEMKKVLFEDEDAIADYRSARKKWEKAAMHRAVARQASADYQATGDEYHLKRRDAFSRAADELNPSGKLPDERTERDALDAYDEREDAGDVIHLSFGYGNEDIDVDGVIRDELDIAIRQNPRLSEIFEEIAIDSGYLDALLKPGSADIFPENFWKHLEEDINDTIQSLK